MRRTLAFIMGCLLLTTVLTSMSALAVPIKVVKDGVPIKMTTGPILEKNTLMAPAKDLLKIMGASYTWESDSKTLHIKHENRSIRIQAGSSTVRVNQEEEFMELPAKIVKNVLFIPVQFTCELFGNAVSYDANAKTIHLKSRISAPTSTEMPVGSIKNDTTSGAWWGENISKVTRTSVALFTFALESTSGQRKAVLMQKNVGGSWMAGQSFSISRPPNLLADSKGYIHVIGFEPFDTVKDSAGRLFHLQFDAPQDVKGSYQKTYLTSEDLRSGNLTLENFASYFYGAAIGSDDSVLVAYENSTQYDTVGTFSIGARLFNPKTKQWTYETVSQKMHSKYAYPFAYVSENYYHVLAIEDMPDPDYGQLTPQHQAYQFRYGAVKHFQRPRSGGNWEETYLINFNDNPNISKQQIGDSSLRIIDFTVDSSQVVHAMIRYNGRFENNRLMSPNAPNFIHYWKTEESNKWQSEHPDFGVEAVWVKFWEGIDQISHYIISNNTGLYLMPMSTRNLYFISKYSAETGSTGPTPFLANKRSVSRMNDELNMVIFAAKTMGISKSITLKMDSQFSKLYPEVSAKSLRGTLSLPEGKVAPKGGLQVLLLASTLEIGAFPIKTQMVIPEGENSASFTLKLNGSLRYRIWYDLQNAGPAGYKNMGVYTLTGMNEYIKKGSLIKVDSAGGTIHLKVL